MSNVYLASHEIHPQINVNVLFKSFLLLLKFSEEGGRSNAHVVEKNWLLNSIGAYEVKSLQDYSIYSII